MNYFEIDGLKNALVFFLRVRHYFVTTVLKGSGNLKTAQKLARHRNIQVTQSYAHLSDDELDKGVYEIFEKKDGKA